MAEKDASARLRRAVKENNLFLVKRLIKRTDMRNADPGPTRFTSLAWAAVLGNEETFEYLLVEGHDDEELSKDVENNTILILLADVKPGSTFAYGILEENPDLMGAALRMARLYHERYPYILEWSNYEGKTSLHVAAIRGNEELVRMFCDLGADIDLPDNLGNTALHYASAWGHIPVVQLLIERGCQFVARNNQGFTASDYAYSTNTMTTLQETARMQFEANKKARRQVFQQSGKSLDWATTQGPQGHLLAESSNGSRLRSGSGGSRTTTATSDSSEAEFLRLSPIPQTQVLPPIPQQQQTTSGLSSWSFSRLPSRNPPHHSPSSSTTTAHSGPSPAQPIASSHSNLSSSVTLNPASVLSPIASRMRERDADAMAKYKRRNRSGSAGTSSDTTTTTTSTSQKGVVTPTNHWPSPVVGPGVAGPPFPASRRLRPSASAAQLRSSPPLTPSTSTSASGEQATPRHRSGTNPAAAAVSVQPPQPDDEGGRTTPVGNSLRNVTTTAANKRAGTVLPSRPSGEDFTGPPRDFAIFPPPPSPSPSATENAAGKPAHTGTGRRAAFALLSKPLPNIELTSRGHRRGISISELRN